LSLLNLGHACTWDSRLFCGEVIFSDCVVFIMLLFMVMLHCYE
jgi:hypothetical protein